MLENMNRPLMLIVWVFLILSTPRLALATTLSDLAAQMQAGEWRVFAPINTSTINDAALITNYADSAAWDPISRRLLFIGSDHATRYKFAIYSDVTNSWSAGPQLPGIPFSTIFVGHAFDGNTADGNGNYYYRVRPPFSGSHAIYKFNATTNAWTNLPDNPLTNESGHCCQAIAYSPELGGLIWLTDSGNIFLFRESTQQWSLLGKLPSFGGTWNFAEYNPVHKVIVFGNANTGKLFKLSGSGQITQLNNIPVSLYDGSGFNGNFTVDPVTGEYLALTASTRRLYRYNVLTDTWQLATTQPPSSLLGSIVSTPISTYGVTVFMSCGTYMSGCAGNLYVYKHSASSATPPPTDTDDPSTPTGLAAQVVSSSQINLSWGASTDNFAVAAYQIERCQGSTCTGFTQIGTTGTTNYGDTGLTSNTTYRYRLRASDKTGNLSPYTTVISPTTQSISTSSTTADADFLARCAAPGVVKCTAFDNTSSDIVSNVNLFPASGGTNFFGTLDTTTKASGAGSLKFTIPASGGANAAGSWKSSLGGNFGQGSTFYVQFRQRFSPEMFNPSTGGGGFKQVIFHHGSATCAGVEITTNNHYWRGFPQMYSQCGADNFYTNLGTGDYLLQNGADFQCHYQTPTSRTPPCGYYHANEWMTFYYRIQIGTWGQQNSTIQAWMGYDGQPLKQFISMTNHKLVQNSIGDASLYNSITLLPYDTGRSSASQTAYTWYDELIVSTQPISAPGVTATQPQTSPAAPTTLTLH